MASINILRSLSRGLDSPTCGIARALRRTDIDISSSSRSPTIHGRSFGVLPRARGGRNACSATSRSISLLISSRGSQNALRSTRRQNPVLITGRAVLRRSYSEVPQKPDQTSGWERLDTKTRWGGVALVIITAFFLSHMERVPETGRWRFMMVPHNVEARLAKNEHLAFLEEYRGRILPPDHPITQQIRTIVSTILEANSLGVLANSSVPSSSSNREASQGANVQTADVDIWDPDAKRAELEFASDTTDKSLSGSGDTLREWNLIVVNDDGVVNAMAGNGNIIIFTGILPVAHDADGLAAVLSHEIAHVVARHVSEKLSAMFVTQILMYGILPLLGVDSEYSELLMKYLYHLPNSRVMELEADKIGIQISSRACFDPRGAVAMQTRLAELTRRSRGKLNIGFLQTHPTGETRIRRLSAALPEAYSIRAASSACATIEDEFDAFRTAAQNIKNEQEREMLG